MNGGTAGGGVALLYAGRNLDAVKDKLTNFDQQVGVQIVQSALKMPLKTIADNAGEPRLIVPIEACVACAWPSHCASGHYFRLTLQLAELCAL